MIRTKLRAALRTAAILVTVLGLLPTVGNHAQAQVDARYFPETGQTVQGRFLDYWEQNGGLMQQGYPISGEVQERSEIDGKVYTMQYFERAVFELHPENQPPNDVLLSLLGVLKYNEKYPGGAPDQRENHDAGGVQFTETGKWVGGSFLVYFNAHGGIRQQGLPISNEFQERSELDGNLRTVQYFERAVFEWNPSNQPPYNVLLAQLGTFAYRAKQQGGSGEPTLLEPVIPSSLDPTKGQYYPHASGRYLVWSEGQIAGPVERQQPYQFDIRALDMATNRPIPVTTAPGNQVDPRLDGAVVAWRSENYACDNCPANGAYAKDLATGKEYTVAVDDTSGNPLIAKSPVVAGRYVAWVQIGNNNRQRLLAKNLDNNTVIEARTLITGTTSTPDVPIEIQGLQGSENFLVWGELSFEPSFISGYGTFYPFNIYAYNLATGQLSNIYSDDINGYYSGYLPVFSLNKGRVLLADKVGNLTLINLANGERSDIPYRGDAQQVELYGNNVLVTADTESSQIDGFGLATDEQQVVHLLQPDPSGLPPYLPRYNATIAGDWLVWGNSSAPNPRLNVTKLDLKPEPQTPLEGAPAIPAPAKHTAQFGPVASGGYLYWQECEIGNSRQQNCAVRGLNTATSDVLTVVSGLGGRVEMAASGASVVWNITPMTCSGPCATLGIYTEDFGGAATAVVTGTTFRTSPAIAGKTVAWSERDDNSVRVMVKDLDTGDTRPVTQNASNEIFINSVQVSDACIAWAEVNTGSVEGHKSSVRVYDRKSGDLGTVFAFDYDRVNIRGLQFSLDGQRIAVKYADTFFVRDLQADKQTDLAANSFVWALRLRGDALVYAGSAIAPGPYSGPQGMGVYGIDLRQPNGVQTLIAPQLNGFQSYEFTTLGDWLVYSSSQSQQPVLTVLPLPQSLKQ